MAQVTIKDSNNIIVHSFWMPDDITTTSYSFPPNDSEADKVYSVEYVLDNGICSASTQVSVSKCEKILLGCTAYILDPPQNNDVIETISVKAVCNGLTGDSSVVMNVGMTITASAEPHGGGMSHTFGTNVTFNTGHTEEVLVYYAKSVPYMVNGNPTYPYSYITAYSLCRAKVTSYNSDKYTLNNDGWDWC